MTSPFPTVPVSHLSHGTVCVSEGASHIPYPWRAERHQTVASVASPFTPLSFRPIEASGPGREW